MSRDEGGRFIRSEHDFINTEASTLEIVETGLGDDLLSEQLWENDEVSQRQNKISGCAILFGVRIMKNKV